MKQIPKAEDCPYRDADTAMAAGSRYFFTGTPCRKGHLSVRCTNNGVCVACRQSRQVAARLPGKFQPSCAPFDIGKRDLDAHDVRALNTAMPLFGLALGHAASKLKSGQLAIEDFPDRMAMATIHADKIQLALIHYFKSFTLPPCERAWARSELPKGWRLTTAGEEMGGIPNLRSLTLADMLAARLVETDELACVFTYQS